MHAWLTMIAGAQAGAEFPLSSERETRIGRGLDCQVVLTDPLSSRVHAIIERKEGAWWVRDHESRNGTFVNDQKIDDAQLGPDSTVRIGTTEFVFHLAHKPPSKELPDVATTQTVVVERAIDYDGDPILAHSPDEPSHDLLLLHQLSVRLLGCDDPDETVDAALGLLLTRVRAMVVGFLWADDEGRLRPKRFVPEEAAEEVTLSRSLTDMVRQGRKAVWIAEHSASNAAESLSHFADAMCVPLIDNHEVVGAIHLYRDRGRFREGDFHFAISVARILAVALVRARRQAKLSADHERLVAKTAQLDELIGESKPMLDLKSKISRVARASGCVLVRGESGVGKELVARALHRASPRADRPMLSVNCAAIPAELMESQLFGHRKGAFTGADADHVGWFQQADTGTLFLDEVGELTLEGQAKLLRILEGHPFLPVGATKETRVDVRVIAATNRDLRDFVQQNRFREDLYYRLSVFELLIPPLRDREGDIGRLMTHFLEHFKRQHGRPTLKLSDDARTRLLSYQWPGNVRQLRNVIDSAVVMAEGEQIEPHDLGVRDAVANAPTLETLRLDHWERKLIIEALARCESSVPKAAKLLGVSRATLYRKIEDYGIDRT